MSFTFLFGLRWGDSGLFTGLMVMAGVVAVVYGFLQAKRDQERDGENLRARLKTRQSEKPAMPFGFGLIEFRQDDSGCP